MHWRVPLGGVTQAGGKFRTRNPMTGHPDIAGILPGTAGRYFTVEVKAARGKFSTMQLKWRYDLEQSGCLVVSARSLQDVRDAFEPFC